MDGCRSVPVKLYYQNGGGSRFAHFWWGDTLIWQKSWKQSRKGCKREKSAQFLGPWDSFLRVASSYRFSLRGNNQPGPVLGRDTDGTEMGIRREQRSISIHPSIQRFIEDITSWHHQGMVKGEVFNPFLVISGSCWGQPTDIPPLCLTSVGIKAPRLSLNCYSYCRLRVINIIIVLAPKGRSPLGFCPEVKDRCWRGDPRGVSRHQLEY